MYCVFTLTRIAVTLRWVEYAAPSPRSVGLRLGSGPPFCGSPNELLGEFLYFTRLYAP